MKYSASANGFFLPDLHGDQIPDDAVELEDDEYAALMEAQSAGKVIQPDADGRPVAVTLAPPTEAERRAAWRERTRLEKGQFVAALLDVEILSGAEAIQAAKGDWPQSFATALSALSALSDQPVDPVKAQVQWGAATHVARLNPLFLAVLGYYATAHSLTAEQAAELGDTIFGWGD